MDITEKLGDLLINKKTMSNGIGKLNYENIKSALVYGFLWGLLAVGIYTSQVGDIFKLNWHDLTNAFVMAFLGFVISTVKNLLTTNKGKFVGVVRVVPPIE